MDSKNSNLDVFNLQEFKRRQIDAALGDAKTNKKKIKINNIQNYWKLCQKWHLAGT